MKSYNNEIFCIFCNMEEILYRYNPHWDKTIELPGLKERKRTLTALKAHLNSKYIILITGLRRIGKTSLLKLLIKLLIQEYRVSPKYIFYISLDDYLLAKQNILEIIDAYRKIHKIKFTEKVYLFLDEITYKEDFQIQLKNIFDSQHAKIFASSSSASLIKRDKPYLTGRNMVYEVLPLDFTEYLQFREISISKSDEHIREKLFEEYMQTGGIPEYVLHKKTEYLRDLVDDIIYKDIGAVHNIKNIQVLKDYFLLLMERAGKQISLNKLAAILRISPDTSRRYFELFTDSFLIFPVLRYGTTNEKLLSAKKIYAPDLGIRHLFTGFRDIGSFFENYVYLKIKKFNPFYLYTGKTEIDFLIEKTALIEAKYQQEPLSEKQQELFDAYEIPEKHIVRNHRMIEQVTDGLSS